MREGRGVFVLVAVRVGVLVGVDVAVAAKVDGSSGVPVAVINTGGGTLGVRLGSTFTGNGVALGSEVAVLGGRCVAVRVGVRVEVAVRLGVVVALGTTRPGVLLGNTSIFKVPVTDGVRVGAGGGVCVGVRLGVPARMTDGIALGAGVAITPIAAVIGPGVFSIRPAAN